MKRLKIKTVKIKDFLKNRLAFEAKSVGEKKCALCGDKAECFDVLRDTFTDLDNLQGRYCCQDCSPLFSTELLKTAFYITTSNIRKLKQNEFAEVLKEIEFPCILSFSASRKKHRLFRSTVSLSPERVFISTDTGEVILNLKKDLKLFDYLNKLYNEFKVTKAELISGEWTFYSIKKVGMVEYQNFLRITKATRGTEKYNLLISFLCKSQENMN